MVVCVVSCLVAGRAVGCRGVHGVAFRLGKVGYMTPRRPPFSGDRVRLVLCMASRNWDGCVSAGGSGDWCGMQCCSVAVPALWCGSYEYQQVC